MKLNTKSFWILVDRENGKTVYPDRIFCRRRAALYFAQSYEGIKPHEIKKKYKSVRLFDVLES
jgi:hypothetical protein